MKGSSNTFNDFAGLESSRLQLHWAAQFMNETERSIHKENARDIAQTVLFYAGLQLELEGKPSPSDLPLIELEFPAKDWLLASEEEIVQASLELEQASPADRRLLQLALYTVRVHSHSSWLSPEKEAELRAYAAPYIRSASKRLHRLAEQWFH